MLSAMQYPHWMIVAGAVLVVLGLIGYAFSRNRNREPGEGNGNEGEGEVNLLPINCGCNGRQRRQLRAHGAA